MGLEIVLATHNQHKVDEFQKILGERMPGLTVLSYDGPEPVEDGTSFEANAFIKARAAAEHTGRIALADDSLADHLGAIEVPTLVIVGNQDILTPRGDSEELAERIPTAELVVISGAAHGLMIEHASTFNRILGDFLSRAEAAYQATLAGAEPTTQAAG